MTLADSRSFFQCETHIPKLLFLSQNNSTVIYAKTFETNTTDPALVACSLNAISIFIKNTFNKTSILNVMIDDIRLRNLCIDDINITYLYEGSLSNFCPVSELADRIVATDVWDMLMDVNCRVPDELLSQIDIIVAELFQ